LKIVAGAMDGLAQQDRPFLRQATKLGVRFSEIDPLNRQVVQGDMQGVQQRGREQSDREENC
jgi:hypothetical protein